MQMLNSNTVLTAILMYGTVHRAHPVRLCPCGNPPLHCPTDNGMPTLYAAISTEEADAVLEKARNWEPETAQRMTVAPDAGVFVEAAVGEPLPAISAEVVSVLDRMRGVVERFAGQSVAAGSLPAAPTLSITGFVDPDEGHTYLTITLRVALYREAARHYGRELSRAVAAWVDTLPVRDAAIANAQMATRVVSGLPRNEVSKLPRNEVSKLPRNEVSRLPRNEVSKLPRNEVSG